jgi:hypothetical protein
MGADSLTSAAALAQVTNGGFKEMRVSPRWGKAGDDGHTSPGGIYAISYRVDHELLRSDIDQFSPSAAVNETKLSCQNGILN